jgi:hypothetical protein
MLKFINDNTIVDEETGITVQIYVNPIALQDYYPFGDIYEKTTHNGNEIMAIWLNEDEALKNKVHAILKSALNLYVDK